MSDSSSAREGKGNRKPRVRLAMDSDVPEMARLLGVLFGIESDFDVDVGRQQRGLHLLLGSPTARIWVAESAVDGIVGMLTLQTLVSTAEGGCAGVIEDLIVADAYRRQGVGTMLVKAAQRYARAGGISRIQLLADVHNVPALIFYRTLGWQQTNLVALRSRLK